MPLPDPQELKRKEEIDRLLSRANYYRLKQDSDQFELACKQIIELDPKQPLAREWLADILHEQGLLSEAAAEYKKLMEDGVNPVSAETKYARVMLEIGEQERQKALTQDMLDNPQRYTKPVRSPAVAMALSFIAPGFGHLYLGDMVKGGIILGVFFFSVIVLAISPSTAVLMKQMLSLLTLGYGGPVEGSREPIGMMAILFSGIALFTYIYAVVDAPILATKTEMAVRKAKGEDS